MAHLYREQPAIGLAAGIELGNGMTAKSQHRPTGAWKTSLFCSCGTLCNRSNCVRATLFAPCVTASLYEKMVGPKGISVLLVGMILISLSMAKVEVTASSAEQEQEIPDEARSFVVTAQFLAVFMSAPAGLLIYLQMRIRRAIRDRDQISGTMNSDLRVAMFCSPCSLCQMTNQVYPDENDACGRSLVSRVFSPTGDAEDEQEQHLFGADGGAGPEISVVGGQPRAAAYTEKYTDNDSPLGQFRA